MKSELLKLFILNFVHAQALYCIPADNLFCYSFFISYLSLSLSLSLSSSTISLSCICWCGVYCVVSCIEYCVRSCALVCVCWCDFHSTHLIYHSMAFISTIIFFFVWNWMKNSEGEEKKKWEWNGKKIFVCNFKFDFLEHLNR